MKKCKKCNIEKEFSEFRKNGFYNGKQKYKPNCKSCINKSGKPKQQYSIPLGKICLKCKIKQNIYNFPKNGKSVNNLTKYRSICKNCFYKTNRRIGEAKTILNECLNCKTLTNNSKYCQRKCQHEYQSINMISRWLEGKEKGYVGKTYAISKTIRKFLLKECNYTCEECSFNTLHPTYNSTILEIDHINGDPSNCSPENLRVLCPNCHAMTDTFRNRNKNSCRER